MNKEKIHKLISGQVREVINEFFGSRAGNITLHPFTDAQANQRNRSTYQELYDELSNAVVMEMLSAYSVEQIRDIAREFSERATQGPGGIGGRFSDEELEEIMELVFDKVQDSFQIDLRSNMPEDRMHPQYMSDD
tara:strand:+ start:2604 stop:3008 length:405 start_codon:yes stop_codon:yes gene_type:complete